MLHAHGWYAFGGIETETCHDYIWYMTTENSMMTRLVLKLENFLAMQSVFAKYPLNYHALKSQMLLHKLFRKTFADAPSNQLD